MILTTAVARVEVHILVDNVTDSLSTVPVTLRMSGVTCGGTG
jgi:hypothetical protein